MYLLPTTPLQMAPNLWLKRSDNSGTPLPPA
jgi:hypothetical protein